MTEPNKPDKGAWWVVAFFTAMVLLVLWAIADLPPATNPTCPCPTQKESDRDEVHEEVFKVLKEGMKHL